AGIARFLRLALQAGRAIVVASNDVDGRLELMAALADTLPTKRIVAVDGGGRFGDHHVSLSAGAGANAAEVVRQALKMRPDRLFVGDCHGPETFLALTALAGSVEGGVVGVTAESPDDAMIRIMRQAGTAVSVGDDQIGGLVHEAADVLVQLLRYADGKLVVTQVIDIDGQRTEVFNGFSATGHVPRWVTNAQSLGFDVDMGVFS
ncbi:MAG: Flp pilus assembly complex ATPase component TadA, partial [Myxococcales bacterium]|nr:Flp pilus assembly complex ATPase component TadA [Myxococcales bacterium]